MWAWETQAEAPGQERRVDEPRKVLKGLQQRMSR